MTVTNRCGGKVKYATYNLAQKAMKNLIRYRSEADLHVYQCPNCHKFHVGHEHSYNISKNEQRRHRSKYKRIKGAFNVQTKVQSRFGRDRR